MPHAHSVADDDLYFVIDPTTREIDNGSKKVKLIQYDHNSEIFTFELPRFVEGHDMSLCDSIRVNYININKSTLEQKTGTYEAKDIVAEDSKVTFAWLISRNATQYVGPLNFLINFMCIDENSVITYEWHTDVFKYVSVSAGMNNEESIEEEYPDILEQWKNDILASIPHVQSDWNENDATSPAFVKNRPFYTGEPVFTEIIPEQTYTMSSTGRFTVYADESGTYPYSLEPDKEYTVVYNGTTYELTSSNIEGAGVVGDTNPLLTGSEPTMPFAIFAGSGILQIIDYTNNTEVTFKISGYKTDIKQIDLKYIPELPKYMAKTNPVGYGSFSLNRKADTTVGENSHAEGEDTTASGKYSHAEGSGTIASELVTHAEGLYSEATARFSHTEGAHTIVSTTDRSVPSSAPEAGMGRYGHAEGVATLVTGQYGAHAEGCKTKSSGNSSHAEGESTIASGKQSHAEGYKTVASGSYSHAEGDSTTASGDRSHAEGIRSKATNGQSHAEGTDSEASGACSHAEGYVTRASGSDSHAEGANTKASEKQSHAEGYYSEASGARSHAEGHTTTASGACSHAEGFYTVASSDCQHVQGKFNIEDSVGVYAHIVGNGDSSTKRSNCHTIDWDGNAWFSGTIEGKSIIIPSSTADSTKKFKITVDDSGTIASTDTSDSSISYTPYSPPAVTEADAGKFLRVSSTGEWAAESITNAEEASF